MVFVVLPCAKQGNAAFKIADGNHCLYVPLPRTFFTMSPCRTACFLAYLCARVLSSCQRLCMHLDCQLPKPRVATHRLLQARPCYMQNKARWYSAGDCTFPVFQPSRRLISSCHCHWSETERNPLPTLWLFLQLLVSWSVFVIYMDRLG